MIYPPEWLDIIQSAPETNWDGLLFRHMFGDVSPAKSNTSGARWNPPGREAIYTSCEPETALAEAKYQISMQPLPPRAKRTLYTLRLLLSSVVDRGDELLQRLGVTVSELASLDLSSCQRVGEAVAWLKYEGLLVPSARRAAGSNLVIFQQDLATSAFEVLESRVISPDTRAK